MVGGRKKVLVARPTFVYYVQSVARMFITSHMCCIRMCLASKTAPDYSHVDAERTGDW